MKRSIVSFIIAAALAFWIIALGGCQTADPGITDTAGAYSAVIDSTPDKVTNAAREALQDMKLIDIVSSATTINGHLTAKDAHNNTITIDVDQAGDNVSRISVRYGVTGDAGISKQIIDKTKSDLSSWRF